MRQQMTIQSPSLRGPKARSNLVAKLLLSLVFLGMKGGAVTLPQTLLELAHVEIKPDLSKSLLILIDYQNEYLDGKLPLYEIDDAVSETQKLLLMARRFRLPVIHVVHQGKPGGAFDPKARGGQF